MKMMLLLLYKQEVEKHLNFEVYFNAIMTCFMKHDINEVYRGRNFHSHRLRPTPYLPLSHS